MAKKFHKRKPYKRSNRNSKKFKKFSKGGTMLTHSVGRQFPQRFRTKLVYNERLASNSNGVYYMIDGYRVNNPFDPAEKTGNYGCFGFKQLSVIYRSFICYGSKIEVWCNSNTDSLCQYLTVVPTDSSIADNDLINNVDGMKYAKSGKPMSIANGGSPNSYVKNYISCSELYGLRKSEIKYDPTLRMNTDGSSINGSTFRAGRWNVICRNLDPSGQPSNLAVVYNIKITYYVEFFGTYIAKPDELQQDSLDLNTVVGAPLYSVLGATGGTAGVGPFVTVGETGTTGNVIDYA